MENIYEKEMEETKQFELDLKMSSADVQDRYSHILLDEQLRTAKENQGKPQGIPVETRKDLFLIAKTTKDVEEARKRVKMQRDWQNATSKDGRPPIGGAQDD